MELKYLNSKKKLKLADEIFAIEFNEPLVHQIVTAYMAGARAGTKAQKSRSAVSGGGSKPFRQKGTGQARAGTIRSPLWRTGGVTFAAQPRCYKQKVNKKMYKGAIRSIISELIRQERLSVVEGLKIDEPKTKQLVAKLNEMKIEGNVLIITESVEENLYLAARNIKNVALLDVNAAAADPVTLVRADKVLVTEAAMKEIEELLK